MDCGVSGEIDQKFCSVNLIKSLLMVGHGIFWATMHHSVIVLELFFYFLVFESKSVHHSKFSEIQFKLLRKFIKSSIFSIKFSRNSIYFPRIIIKLSTIPIKFPRASSNISESEFKSIISKFQWNFFNLIFPKSFELSFKLSNSPSLFIADWKHFANRQARHWFLWVLSTGQRPFSSPAALHV